MADIEDYILWRADLSFAASAFNEIDALILCQLSYINFDGIISDSFGKSITLQHAAKRYAELYAKVKNKSLGVFINQKTIRLLEMAGKSERFGSIVLKGFINDTNTEEEKQFCALTAVLPSKQNCIVFRGTDDSLIGWKEDFNMTVQSPIPAQKSALAYVTKAWHNCKGKLFLAGHSKGGNLAVYASLLCPENIAKSIEIVFCFDGPGFYPPLVADSEKLYDKVRSFVPQSSLVGSLLHYPKKQTIVHSNEITGIRQHDPFSWQLSGPSFVRETKRTAESIFIEKTVNAWLQRLDKKARTEFIKHLFDAAGAGGASTLRELKTHWLQTSAATLKMLHHKDREQIFGIFKIFFKAVHSNISDIGSSATSAVGDLPVGSAKENQ